MSNPIPPTPGRIVLVTVADTTGRRITLPAMITHVGSDDNVSVVAFSAFADAGTDAGGTKPMTGLAYDEERSPNTWRWMDYQKGQAAKTEQVTAEMIGKACAACFASGNSELLRRMDALESQIIALNQKQPASQRVPVADASLNVVPPIPRADGVAFQDSPPGAVAPSEGQTEH